MNVHKDTENGDLLIEHDGIYVARVPAIVEQKYPGMALRLAGNAEIFEAAADVARPRYTYDRISMNRLRDAFRKYRDVMEKLQS